MDYKELSKKYDEVLDEFDNIKSAIYRLKMTFEPIPHSDILNENILNFLLKRDVENWICLGFSGDLTRPGLQRIFSDGQFIYSTNGRFALKAKAPDKFKNEGTYLNGQIIKDDVKYPNIKQVISEHKEKERYNQLTFKQDKDKMIIYHLDKEVVKLNREYFILATAFHGMKFDLSISDGTAMLIFDDESIALLTKARN